jgi:hypothetical protein
MAADTSSREMVSFFPITQLQLHTRDGVLGFLEGQTYRKGFSMDDTN